MKQVQVQANAAAVVHFRPLFIKRKLTRLSHRVRVSESGKSPSKADEQAEGENQTTSKVP